MTAVRAVQRIRLAPQDGVNLADADVAGLPTGTAPVVIIDIGPARYFGLSVPSRIACLAYGSDFLQVEGEHFHVAANLAELVEQHLAGLRAVG